MFGKSILGGVTINVCYGEIGRYSIIFLNFKDQISFLLHKWGLNSAII